MKNKDKPIIPRLPKECVDKLKRFQRIESKKKYNRKDRRERRYL
jgi:hypothetical protein